jgi:Predicted O-methyltransferase
VSGFEADWLALRSDADARARDPALLAAAAERVGDGLALDLGAGTGATLWALAPQAPAARWRLVDDDPALLQEAERRAETLGARAETLRLDLARHPGGGA